jgi:hypothetical protein
MKNLVLKPIVFKRPFTLLLGTAMILTAISCSDDDSNGSAETTPISEEEAAEAILLSVSPEAGGMTEESLEAIYILEDESYAASKQAGSSSKATEYVCGEEYNSSYVITKESGSITYDINYAWNWVVGCDADGNPISYDFALDGTGVYTTPRMSSSGSDVSEIEIVTLDEQQDMYQLNEEFSRTGTHESFIRDENAFSSTISLSTDNLRILKSNYNIVSGTVAASFSGIVSNGNTYDYSGVVVFHGNQTATLTMGSGNTYELAW